MAKGKKVESITARDVDFAQWYTDVVKKADLIGYTSVKGCTVLKPAGFAIWENMKEELDRRFKATGVQNVYLPMFIPEGLLQKEKDHVEGFAPEVAWVTHGGENELQERICVRPTSETLFCDLYAKDIQSFRDLPKLYNQWCSVVRWEKTTRPFLRSREFLWQEGHTAHATAEEAQERTVLMHEVYANFIEEVLAIPLIRGKKTEKEKFAGANATYTVEALMHDGKALQCATSHNFGDGFARAFDIQYTDKENHLQYVHQTSWGFTTRMVGAIIMVHGDDDGLVLPPKVAPTQVAIIPIRMENEAVMAACEKIKAELEAAGVRTLFDTSDKSPGWKFAEHEMRGVPIRLEIGPRDVENGQMVLARRDSGEKITAELDGCADTITALLDTIQADRYERAKEHLASHIFEAKDYEEFKDIVDNKPGFVKAHWCGCTECEEAIKDETTATIRCIPHEGSEPDEGATCIYCGKPAKYKVYLGKAY